MTTRSTRRPATTSRTDTNTTTGTAGLTNARTRLVGSRTGVLADVVVAVVRYGGLAGRAVARATSRMSAVITPLGWVMLGLIPISFAVGYALGWMEFVTIAWAGVVLVVVATLYLIGRTPYRMTLSLPHRRVVVGESAVGVVTVANPVGPRIFGTKLEIPIGSALAELAVPSLRRGAELEQQFAVPTVRRGIVAVGPVRTVRATSSIAWRMTLAKP